ncbi:glycosyltransferase family 8 protein [Devosia rhodophyticola]|uniref:Glycosyltransferase family 8 protein n=1 Tax=Devosia rhodophyticola TaxID=3026423 RepID=A0ABY7Z2A5_9HYPH|nr:glycosyltransferase family 8 protein [Devosia rhodophyticola]WDR07125.1 glycosyltransferase family 8 protein [Devosia rhodophyticola]
MTQSKSASTSQPMHIALTFDDNFWAPAYAVMRSVCVHTKRKADLVFHLCHRTMSDAHKADLAKIAIEFGAKLVWYDLDQSDQFNQTVDRIPAKKRFGKIVYARLLLDRLIDPSIERVVYLDCDVLVRAPIEQLYDVDLGDCAIGAVRDTMGGFITGGRDLAHNGEIFDIADPYFNSGVIVIDIAKWREADIGSRIDGLLADGTMDKLYFDQDILNLIFVNKWQQLPARWNTIDARGAHEGMDVALLHYTGPSKPWNLISTVAYRRFYRHVMTNELFYRFMRHRWKRYWAKKFGR